MQGVIAEAGTVPTAADLRALEECVRWHIAVVPIMCNNEHAAGMYHELCVQRANHRHTLQGWHAMYYKQHLSTAASAAAAGDAATTATTGATAATDELASTCEAEMCSYELVLLSSPDLAAKLVELAKQLNLRSDLRASPLVKFANRVRLAVRSKDYRTFFKLFTEAPFLIRACMISLFAHMRATALCALADSSSEIALSEVTELLCFLDEAEAVQYCLAHNLAVCDESIVFRVSNCSDLLYKPGNMSAATVAAAESATASARAAAAANGITLCFSEVGSYAMYYTVALCLLHCLLYC
jgi:SAC3/GANP family